MKHISMLVGCMLFGISYGQLPELIHYQFNAPGTSVTNYAIAPVGINPAPITGNLQVAQGGFLNSQGLTGTGSLSGTNKINTGWATRINGSFTLAFYTAKIPVSNGLTYFFGDQGAGEFRCFTNGVAGNGNLMARGGGLPDLPINGAATYADNMVHLVYDAAAATYTAYLNGVKQSQLSVDSIPNLTGTGLSIGGYENNSGLNGLLDEIRWYSRALDSTEIINTYDIDLSLLGNCNPFSHFMVDSITATTAQASWHPGSGNSAWFMEYGPTGFARGSGTAIQGTYPTAAPPVVLSGLLPKTGYDLYLGELCGSSDSVYMPNPVRFATSRLCASPAGLSATATSPYDVQVTWSGNGTAPAYSLIYGYHGFDPSLGGTTVSASGSLHNVSGLSPAFTYDFYLAANCGGITGTSDTIGPVSAFTLCAAVGLFPFNEDFESAATGRPGTVPNCWSITSPGNLSWQVNQGATPSVATGPKNDHTTDSISGHYLYLETSLNGVSSEIQTPEFDLTGLSRPVVSFWYHMYGGTMGVLELQVSAGTAGPWTTISRLTGQQHTASSENWSKAEVDVTQFKGTNTQFRFVGYRGVSFTGDMAIDDFSVGEGPLCPKPALFLQSATDSSATFQIIGGGSSYQLEFGAVGFTPGTGCTMPSGNGLVTVTNTAAQACGFSFTANTAYDIYVTNDCGSNGTSATVGPLAFRTACGGYYAPYFNDFDNEPLHALPSCWSMLVSGASVGSGTAENYDYGVASTAPNHLRIYNGGGVSANDTTLVTGPLFYDLSDGDKQLRFMAQTLNPGVDLIVGTVGSTGNAGSFSAIDTLHLSTQYRPYVVSLNVANGRYNGTDSHIAFLHGNGTAYSTIFIDDFNYEDEPACVPPLLADMYVNGIQPNAATLHWPAGSEGEETHLEWGLPGFAPGSGSAVGSDSVPGMQDQLTITGLSPNTVYEVYLKDSCAVDGFSPWVGPLSFRTGCTVMAAPFFENFDGNSWSPGSQSSAGDALNVCWSRIPQDEGEYRWGVFNGSTPSLNSGPIKDRSGSGNYIYTEASFGIPGDRAEFYTPWIDLSALSSPYLSFYVHRLGNDLGGLLVEARDGTTTWDTLMFLNTELQAAEANAFVELGSGLAHLSDTVRIRFTAISGGCCAGDMAIDEIKIDEAPPCPGFGNLAVQNIVDTAALATWDTTTGASYQLWLGAAGSFNASSPGAGLSGFVSGNQLQFDTLTASTCYQLRLRAICQSGDTSAWTAPVDFCTPCPAILAPYSENFDLLAGSLTGDLGNCWRTSNGSLVGYGFRSHSGSTLTNNTGPLGDATTGTGTYLYTEASSGAGGDEASLYSPLLDLSALASPELRFSYHLYGMDIDTLHVDVNDGSGWSENIFKISGPQQFANFEAWKDTAVDLSAFSGNIQLRFRTYRGTGFNGDLALDDITVADPLTCPAPFNLHVDPVTTSSAELRWEGGTKATFELAYGQALASLKFATRTVVIGNSFSMTNLTGSAQYGFFARKICAPGDTSQWAGPFVFYTPCINVVAAPYYANFEAISLGNKPAYENCWTTDSSSSLKWEAQTAMGVNQNTVGTGPHFDNTLNPFAGGTYMFLESSGTGTSAELLSPVINVSGLNNPELVYHYHLFGQDINKLEVYAEDAATSSRYLVDSIVGQRQVLGELPFWEQRLNLNGLPISTYRIVFVAYKGAGYKGDIAIDDVWIDEVGSNVCPAPVALAMTGKGCDSISINWASAAPIGLIEYGPAGFAKGSGTLIGQVSPPYTITGLSPNTTYDVLVGDLCNNDTSAYAAIRSITTDAAPVPMASFTYSDSVAKAKGLTFFRFDASASQNATTYEWDFGNGLTGTGVEAFSSYAFNGKYTVTLVAVNGCGRDSTTREVNMNISLDENPLGHSLKLYPNPAKDMVNLSFKTQNDGHARIRVMDISGKELLSLAEENINGMYQGQLDLAKLASGVYLLQVEDGHFTTTRKLIRKK